MTTSREPGPWRDRRADVELRLPADGAYASVLRTTAAGLAARLEFTMDDIEDLRIATSEASALALPEADSGSDLHCRFYLEPTSLTLTLTVSSATPTDPDYDSFAWQVLSTLAGDSGAETSSGEFTVWLTMRSSLTDPTDHPGHG